MNNPAVMSIPLGVTLPSPVEAVKNRLSSVSDTLRKHKSSVTQRVVTIKESVRLRNETNKASPNPLQETIAFQVAVALEDAYPIYGQLCSRDYIKDDVQGIRIYKETLRLASEEINILSPYLLQVAMVR